MLVTKIKELQKSDPDAKQQWIQYTTLEGNNVRDPAKHDAKFINNFLKKFNAGVRFGGVGMGGGDPVTQIKELQRTNPDAKEQWILYCTTEGDNVRDPSKHDSSFIENFISNYNSGNRLDASAGGGGDFVELFKFGQRESPAWKQAWTMYCAMNGGGKNDPARHDKQYCVGFMEFLAKSAFMQMGMAGQGGGKRAMSPGIGGMGGPLMKRAKTDTPTGNAKLDKLVMRIKTFQRGDASQKEVWWGYADQYLDGVRDPARHDVATLEEFCRSHGV